MTGQAVVETGQAALTARAKPIPRDDFDITAGTFGDQAAAAAAQALHRLTDSYELPDAEVLIRDHGVAPRYRLWLERMLPEVARVGMGAEPVSSQAIAGVDHFGFGPEALDFLDKVIASLPDLLTERQHSSSIYLDAKTPDVYARLFATPNAVIGSLIAKLAEARPLSLLEVGGGLGTTLSAIEPALPADRIAYHFTDVNQLFLRAAAAKFAGRPWLSFGLFDLDGPVPAEHAGRHDVIVASSAAHVAKDVAQALVTLRACLKPGWRADPARGDALLPVVRSRHGPAVGLRHAHRLRPAARCIRCSRAPAGSRRCGRQASARRRRWRCRARSRT